MPSTTPTAGYVGIDLAWNDRARTGLAVVDDSGRLLRSASAVSDEEIDAWLDSLPLPVQVAAIDAPLVVTNPDSMRPCERQVSAAFGRYDASCHASNTGMTWMNPPRGGELSRRRGWSIDPDARGSVDRPAAIEVYPHAAMVGLFRLGRILKYKKGSVATRRAAFVDLMAHLESVQTLELRSNARWLDIRTQVDVAQRPMQLDAVEDEVDAILCAHLAWLWHHRPDALRVYGEGASGFIVAPPRPTHPAAPRPPRPSGDRPAAPPITIAGTGGQLDWAAGRTWYRIVEPDAGAPRVTGPPVVVLHGGPGAAHDYVEPIADLLVSAGHTCVLYDQLGCGRSQHLPDAPSEFWTPQLFNDELVALLDHLGHTDSYVLVGQSWGGMLAMQHALDRPAGLRALVIADSPASMELWVAEANRLRAELPPDVDATLRRHEDAGTTDDPAYEAAMQVFYDRHLCRVPAPECVQRTFAQLAEDPTVYRTMNGPSEFHVIGSLSGWDITDRLGDIDVPTLLVSGAYDEATPRIVRDMQQRIPGARWELFAWSSHLPHIEEPAHFRDVVAGFLAELV